MLLQFYYLLNHPIKQFDSLDYNIFQLLFAIQFIVILPIHQQTFGILYIYEYC